MPKRHHTAAATTATTTATTTAATTATTTTATTTATAPAFNLAEEEQAEGAALMNAPATTTEKEEESAYNQRGCNFLCQNVRYIPCQNVQLSYNIEDIMTWQHAFYKRPHSVKKPYYDPYIRHHSVCDKILKMWVKNKSWEEPVWTVEAYNSAAHKMTSGHHTTADPRDTTDDFYDMHLDVRNGPTHKSTLIAVPPLNWFPHKGGELRVEGIPKVPVVNETEWMFVRIPLGLPYSVEPVTEGRMLMLVTEGHLNTRRRRLFALNFSNNHPTTTTTAEDELSHAFPDRPRIEDVRDWVFVCWHLHNSGGALHDEDQLVLQILHKHGYPVHIAAVNFGYLVGRVDKEWAGPRPWSQLLLGEDEEGTKQLHVPQLTGEKMDRVMRWKQKSYGPRFTLEDVLDTDDDSTTPVDVITASDDDFLERRAYSLCFDKYKRLKDEYNTEKDLLKKRSQPGPKGEGHKISIIVHQHMERITECRVPDLKAYVGECYRPFLHEDEGKMYVDCSRAVMWVPLNKNKKPPPKRRRREEVDEKKKNWSDVVRMYPGGGS